MKAEPHHFGLFAGPGTLREELRTRDWSLSAVGHPDTWPVLLRNAVSLMLDAHFPMFVIWGPERTFLYNSPYIALLESKHPAAIGAPVDKIWPELWDDVRPLIEKTFAGESTYGEDVLRTFRRDGQEQQSWFTLSYSPIREDNGDVAGALCIIKETTKRVLLERRQALQLQLADRLRDLSTPEEVIAAACEVLGLYLDASQVCYVEIDESLGKFEIKSDWSQHHAGKLAGYTGRLEDYGSEAISVLRSGTTLSVTDVQTDERTAPYADLYASIAVRSVLALPLSKDGKLVATLNVYDSKPRHWLQRDLKLAEDIAERAWPALERACAETSLRANEARQAMLLALGDTLRDLHEDPDAMMAAATKALAHSLGVPRVGYASVDEAVEYAIVGQRYDDIAHGPGISTGVARLDDYGPALIADIRAGRVIRVDDLAVDPRSAGAAADAHISIGARATLAAPVQRHGRTVAFMFAHHDAPRRWTDEEAELIRQTADHTWAAVERARAEQALRKADQRKDEFLAMLAHELRNPIAPINAAAELLALGNLEPERIRITSDIIIRQVDHMTGLINDLLDVSRVTRRLITLDKKEVDIKQVVADAVEQVRPLIEARRHYLVVHMAHDYAYVLGEQKRLVQVLANLLVNAAKYTPDGGEIDVRMDVNESEVVLCVSDNGIGMAPDFIPAIFDLFAQAERTPDRSQGGMGLGLALVKSLVQLHGGSVAAHSGGTGSGSTLTIRLPRLALPKRPPVQPSRNAALLLPSRALRLMVVDDNADAATTLAMFLESAGHQVIVEHEARSALARARQQSFDACLLDIGLPDMDGNALARCLRLVPGTEKALLIAVTGYGQQFVRESAMEAGFDHYFVKPASPTRLIALLEDMYQT